MPPVLFRALVQSYSTNMATGPTEISAPVLWYLGSMPRRPRRLSKHHLTHKYRLPLSKCRLHESLVLVVKCTGASDTTIALDQALHRAILVTGHASPAALISPHYRLYYYNVHRSNTSTEVALLRAPRQIP